MNCWNFPEIQYCKDHFASILQKELCINYFLKHTYFQISGNFLKSGISAQDNMIVTFSIPLSAHLYSQVLHEYFFSSSEA